MEGGVVGSASEDDGRKAVARRVEARGSAPGDCKEGPRRRGQGKGGNAATIYVTAEEFSNLSRTFIHTQCP